jgi:hypothetical protein
VIPPAIHSFYFFDPNGIRLEITYDLDGDEEDLQVIRSCSMTETELRAELETISNDRVCYSLLVLDVSVLKFARCLVDNDCLRARRAKQVNGVPDGRCLHKAA